jgi:hypothetical protein
MSPRSGWRCITPAGTAGLEADAFQALEMCPRLEPNSLPSRSQGGRTHFQPKKCVRGCLARCKSSLKAAGHIFSPRNMSVGGTRLLKNQELRNQTRKTSGMGLLRSPTSTPAPVFL